MSGVETPQSKNQAISQATAYASLPNNGPQSSDSGVYHPPPEPVIQEIHPLKQSYSESEIAQYESVHSTKETMPNLIDVNATKDNETIYNYEKNQPKQKTDALTLGKSNPDETGLVSIYAGTETKNGVTTEKTVTPELAYTETLYGKTFPLYYPVGNRGGEAVSFLRVPFAKSLGLKGIGTGTDTVQETRLTDPLQFTLGLGSGLIGKGTELAGKGLEVLSSRLAKPIAEETPLIIQPKVKTAPSEIADLVSQHMQEGKMIMSTPEKVTNDIIQLHQGVPPSGVSSIKYSELAGLKPEVIRLPSGEVKAVKPEPPSYFKPTQTGIGAKGEPVTFENIININQEQEGLPKIPSASINLEEKSLTLLRGEGVSKLEPTQYIVEVQGGAKLTPLEEAGLAVHLGAEKYQVENNIFKYEATDLTKSLAAKNISPGEKKMPLLMKGTHLFKFSLENNPKDISMKLAVTKEPEIIKGSRLPEAERPNVIETLIMKHPSSIKYVPPKPFESKTKTEARPTKETFDKERYPLMTSHEQSTHAETVLKAFTKSEAPTNKPLESIIHGGRVESHYETLAYPKGIENKFLSSFKSANEILSTSLRGNKSQTIITESEQIQKTRNNEAVDLLNKNVSDTLKIKTQHERSISDLLNKNEQLNKQSQIPKGLQSTKSDLTTKQTTGEVNITTTTNNPPPNLTGKITTGPPNITFEEKKRKTKKLKSRKANQVNFLGNAPQASVVGLTRRADITYGNKLTAKLAKKDISNTIYKKSSNFSLYKKISKHISITKKLHI